MASEIKCEIVSVTFEKGDYTGSYTSCWSQAVPDSGWSSTNVTTGLRKSITEGAAAWRTCQYFMKGMSAICTSWNGSTCANKDKPGPSGYNEGNCDFLGRRNWCSKYEPSGSDKLDEWICVAPNPYLTGLTMRAAGKDSPIVSAVPKSKIEGYNPDSNGVGQCDCYGMGRGADGCAKVGATSLTTIGVPLERELEKLPVVCSFYRSWRMGFGAIAPHEARLKDGSPDLEAMLRLVETDAPYEYRMPLSFYVYNCRAAFRKCLWYESDFGGKFTHDDWGFVYLAEESSGEPFDESGHLVACKCNDSAALPYSTRLVGDEAPVNIMANVWAKAGTVVCNGAKPECPCYSADWIYPIDEKMWAGMPVTAQQVLELRFWSNDWESQKEYDEYFARKPNSTDPRTSDIYTFRGWENISSDADVAQMHGNRVRLKQPCESDNRYFDPALYITGPKVVYAKYGATTGGQVTFSNLIDLLSGLLDLADDFKEFFLAYPYFNDDSFSGSDPTNQQPGYTKPTNEIAADRIYTVGQTVRAKSVYALNLTVLGSPGMLTAYENTFKLKTEQKELLNSQITNLISDALEKNYEYISKTVSGEKVGLFVTDPIKLVPGDNLILVCADVGNGQWRFKKRKVKSLWCGGYIRQSSFSHIQNPGLLNSIDFEFQPFSFKPPAKVSAVVSADGGSYSSTLYPVRSYAHPLGTNYYSYSITETEETVNSKSINKLKWFSIGNSWFVWCEIVSPDINSLFHWEFVSAKMINIPVDERKGKVKPKAKAYPPEIKMIRTELNIDYMAPNAIMLSPENTNTARVVFSPNEWFLEMTYKYQKLTAGIGSGGVISGAGSSDNNKYKSLDVYLGGDTIYSENVNKDTLAVMAIFDYGTNINNTRPIAAVATRLLVYATDVRCRGVDILYRYSADGKEYVLVPNTGFSINPGGDLPVGMATHTSFPFCGDHECGDPCYGPMWFPYNVCTTKDYYQLWAITASCAQAHDRTPKQIGEYRYMGPEMYKARAEIRDPSGSTCKVPFAYYYSNASAVEPTFTGYANVKGKVDAAWYTANSWKLPPFGNDGRDLIERFVSQEFHYHYDVTKSPPPIISEWVAMAMDQNAFYMGFNAFKDYRVNDPRMDDIDFSNTIKSGLDQFHFTNQMNFLTYGAIENVKDMTRYRWEQIFKSDATTPATYPPPVRGEEKPTVDFYIFKDDRYCWAWRDLPTPPARGSSKLNFVNEYKYPPYVFSSIKEEVRLGIEEGIFQVKYMAPKKDPKTGETGIIANIMGRSFKILYGTPSEVTYRAGTPDEKKIQIYQYSSYDYHEQDYVEWMDEGGAVDDVVPVELGGSSKKDNSYEVCFSSKWIFGQEPELFRNIIFVPPGPVEGKSFWSDTEVNPETGTYSKLFYRWGLIVNITRNRLMYLPKYEFEGTLAIEATGATLTTANGDVTFTIASTTPVKDALGFPPNGVILNGGGHTWVGNESIVDDATLGAPIEVNTVVISKIVIIGQYGRLYSTKTEENTSGEYVFLKPGFNMSGNTVDGEEGYIPRGFPSITSVVPDYPKKPGISNMIYYSIIINLPISPLEMLKKGYKDFSFTIIGGPVDTYIHIESITVTTVEYREEATETITVYERKYLTSTSSATLNPDGPEEFLRGTNGGGIHFNFQSKPDEERLQAENKIRGAHTSSKLYHIGNDTPIDIGIGSLFEIEAVKQRTIYEEAIRSDPRANTKTYSGWYPPNLARAITMNKITNATRFGKGGFAFDCEPLSFSSHPVVSDKFNQYRIWRPGGHKFIWGSSVEHMSCELERLSDGRIINATWEDVVSAKFQHITHGGDKSDEVMSALNSFYSGRFYYEKARYDNQYEMTGKEPEGGMDLVNASKIGDYYGH